MQRWYCNAVDQLPSVLNNSSHISRTIVPVPVPLNDSHKSKSIGYTQVELWELELMQTALWFIYAHLLMMKNSEIIQELGWGLKHTMLDQLFSKLREKVYI